MARPASLSFCRATTRRALGLCALVTATVLPAAAQAAGPPTVSVAHPFVDAVWTEGRIFNVAATDPDGLASARFVLTHLASGKQILDTTVPITGSPTQVGGPNSPVGTSWLTAKSPGPDGRYEILMRVTDSTGTSGEARRVFTYDPTAPTIVFTAAPAAAQPGAPVTWVFKGDDGPVGSGVQTMDCRIDAGAWAACPSGDHFTATGLSVGDHVLEVRATDGGGLTKTERQTVAIDGTAPTASIQGGLADGARTTSLEPAVWSFASSEAGSFECRISRVDDPPGAWGPCRLPTSHRPGDLDPGAYVFQVRALDLAGNASEPASRTFTYAPQLLPPSINQTGGLASVEFRYRYALRARRGKIVVSDLHVTRLTAGATLTATCKGKQCPKAVKLKRRGTKWRLTSLIGRALPRGTDIVISATKPGAIGKYVRLTLAAPGKQPKVTERCLAPGSTKPVRCAKS